MTLKSARKGRVYKIQKIDIDDRELLSFLFTLGCYAGEKIRVVSRTRGAHIVLIKGVRYCIDNRLADSIYL